jgi:hypothetical protein
MQILQEALGRNIGAVAPKLGKLIPRLASNHDGERLATLNAIDRTLRAYGADWNDLASLFVAPSIVPEPKSRAAARPPDWRTAARKVAGRWCNLTPKEQKFLVGLGRLRGEPSTKQIAWLLAIHDRLWCGE